MGILGVQGLVYLYGAVLMTDTHSTDRGAPEHASQQHFPRVEQGARFHPGRALSTQSALALAVVPDGMVRFLGRQHGAALIWAVGVSLGFGRS